MEELDKRLPQQIQLLMRDHSPEEIWSVRSFVHQNLSDKPNADALLTVTRDYYEFMTQIRSSVSSADYTKLARTIELGRDAIDLLDWTFFEQRPFFRRMMAMLLITGSNYLANSSYIQASLETCEGLVKSNQVRLYDHCWELSRRMGTDNEIGEDLDKFFFDLFSPDVPMAQRIVLTFFLYRFLSVLNFYLVMKGDR